MLYSYECPYCLLHVITVKMSLSLRISRLLSRLPPLCVPSSSFSSRLPMDEARFSKSAAFQGRSRGAGVISEPCQFDYYSTDEFSHKKLLSAIGSIFALIVYFGWLREPSDLDEILNTPPHILTASLERKMLRDQINQATAKGEDTTLLQAQLEYVDVKEEALKVQFQNKKK